MVIKSLVFKPRCGTCSWWATSGATTQQSTSLTRLVFQPLPYYCKMSGRGRGPASQRRNGDETAALAQISIVKGQIKELQEELIDRIQLLESSISDIYSKQEITKLVSDLMRDEMTKLRQEMEVQIVQAGPIRDTVSTGGYKSFEEVKREEKRVESLIST
jgi:hypothetical protein